MPNLRERISRIVLVVSLGITVSPSLSSGEGQALLDSWDSLIENIRIDRLDGYRGAISFIKENGDLIRSACEAQGCEPAEMLPIVFPELLRAAWLTDVAQAQAIALTYPILGSAVLDFSIGPFQMKPSFAEYLDSARAMAGQGIAEPESGLDERIERVDRLRNVGGQLGYLGAFARFILNRHGRALAGMTDEEKIAFLAAAYNGPLEMGSREIIESIPRSAFPVVEGGRKKTLPYAFIALAFWRSGSANISSRRGVNR